MIGEPIAWLGRQFKGWPPVATVCSIQVLRWKQKGWIIEPICAAPQWQPIESAPKDGTTIIGFSAAVGEPMLVRFIAPQEFLTTGECEMQLNVACEEALKAAEDWLNTEAWFYADFSVGDICDSACQPTHWMPLPNPPEIPND